MGSYGKTGYVPLSWWVLYPWSERVNLVLNFYLLFALAMMVHPLSVDGAEEQQVEGQKEESDNQRDAQRRVVGQRGHCTGRCS